MSGGAYSIGRSWPMRPLKIADNIDICMRVLFVSRGSLGACYCSTCAHDCLRITLVILSLYSTLMFIHYLFGNFLKLFILSHIVNIFSWVYQLKVATILLLKFFTLSILAFFDVRPLIQSHSLFTLQSPFLKFICLFSFEFLLFRY